MHGAAEAAPLEGVEPLISEFFLRLVKALRHPKIGVFLELWESLLYKTSTPEVFLASWPDDRRISNK